ncbi:homogentisate 1,2-dioxygenase [Bradyrhizobium diazoefficiens]
MNINTSPDQIIRSSAQVTPGYMSGFGNSFETEALPGALPIGRNSPQRCAYGLYAEQLSGSPFTAPRGTNERSWLYRIRPSVKHSGRFEKADAGLWRSAPCHEYDLPIAQMRWDPTPVPKEEVTFVQGVQTMTTAGDVNTQAGMAAHVYLITKSMVDQHFYNADGELMFVLQQGNLRLVTEFGRIDAEPGEIVVIPRGVKFRVEIPNGPARGYLCENYGGAFTLPERGPIGANCLANARDFLTPVANYEDKDTPTELFVKWGGSLFKTTLPHSPIDVVAWHGNYAPYKYDLRTFSPVGAIGFDHPDPSIFTVLTSPSETAGTANIDFVIFPERWMVADNTFRPPWYHMNIMSEFMGLIYGVYDAKPQGFVPGGMSLHNCMLPHGPDRDAFEHASNGELKPVKLTGTMAFMFETRYPPARHRACRERVHAPGRLRRLLEGPGEAVRSEQAVVTSSFRDAPEAQARNPYSRSWLWIPGSRSGMTAEKPFQNIRQETNAPPQRSQPPLLHRRRSGLRLPDPEPALWRVLDRGQPDAAGWRRDRQLRARSLGARAGLASRCRRARRVLGRLAQSVHGAGAEGLGKDAGADQRAPARGSSGAARQ